ncbi:MAG: flagellar hook-associated protein FlgL [Verrucomicrobia bacterium]|nr:flagellar hook-associated protein FlgL [Verrucomicrobiota bacterium]
MRVTANTFPTQLLGQLNDLAERQNKLQEQASTGQRVITPDDDPSAMRRVLDLQTEQQSITQFSSNIARHQEMAQTTFSALRNIQKVADRAQEITTLADGLKSPQELATYAAEVTQLIKQAAQIANTQDRGSYIFAGTKPDQPAFVTATDASGNITSVTYQGNQSLPVSEIAEGQTITAQVVGGNNTGTGSRGLFADSRAGADLFNHLIALQNDLASGNTAAIQSTDSANLSKDSDNVLFHIGTNGAVQERLNASKSLLDTRKQNIETLVSNEADADLATTLTRLSQVQTAYKAAIQSGALVMNQSLLDYLH